jgi:amino acid transporter
MRRAGWIAAGISSLFYVGATIALLVILSPDKISELNGFVEAGDSAGKLLGAAWLSALIAILVIASGVGFVGGNGTASSRLPYSAAVDGLLPKAFARLHPKWNTPYISTLALAAVSTFLLVIYQLGDTMRVAYVELVGCTTYKWKLSRPAFLPVVFKLAIQTAAAECQDRVGSSNGPEHS